MRIYGASKLDEKSSVNVEARKVLVSCGDRGPERRLGGSLIYLNC